MNDNLRPGRLDEAAKAPILEKSRKCPHTWILKCTLHMRHFWPRRYRHDLSYDEHSTRAAGG